MPAGWDRFLAKRNRDVATTYEGYPFVDQGVPLTAGATADAYATTMLAEEAESFLRGASAEAPWFLVFAPSAPHEPWTPAPQDVGTFDGVPIAMAGERAMNDVDGTRRHGCARFPRSTRQRRTDSSGNVVACSRPCSLSIERSPRWSQQVRAQGELGDTLIILLSDNGFSFGEHRWVGKRCPYEACVRVPLVMRTPWSVAGEVETPVTNVDLAPTILDVTGIRSCG